MMSSVNNSSIHSVFSFRQRLLPPMETTFCLNWKIKYKQPQYTKHIQMLTEIFCKCWLRKLFWQSEDVNGWSTFWTHRSMRWRVLCSGGLMLCVEEMVLCGLSCSMCVSRCSALGFSCFPLFSSVMYKLSFSLLRTLFMPPLFCWPLVLFFSCELQVFSQASVASLNSTTLSGSSVLHEIISLSSIMKSFCGWKWSYWAYSALIQQIFKGTVHQQSKMLPIFQLYFVEQKILYLANIAECSEYFLHLM